MHTSDLVDNTVHENPSSPTPRHKVNFRQSSKPEQLHVLDLPPLYTKPGGEQLLSILERLALKPASFESFPSTTGSGPGSRASVDEEGIPRYLTSIVSSSLQWIEGEATREEIWECASRRLAERAGRSAMSSLTRRFKLPGDGSNESIKTISIYEPTLTADNLGHKTWSSSYLLSIQLPSLAHLLPHIDTSPLKVLELGSGTGLFGIAFAALFSQCKVLLTDLAEIIPNLKHNILANQDNVTEQNSTISATTLDWNTCPALSNPTKHPQANAIYDIILAADPIYSPSHPTLLTRAIAANLKRSSDARLIIGLPIRDAYLPQIKELWTLLADLGLEILLQGEEECTDDWIDRSGERVMVRVRWAVWVWSERMIGMM